MGKKKKKRLAKRKKQAKKIAVAAISQPPSLNYRRLEAEINRLSELLQTIKKKSRLVRSSLAYLEREQKKVRRQLQNARTFLLRLKNRGMKVIQNFPHTAEELYRQLKSEFNRLSRRWVS